jgi:hypothetical protein
VQSLARDGLSAAEVTALLQADALTVSGGLELLAPDLSVVEDISDDLLGGQVEHSLHATIHRTCDLSLSRSLVWGVDLVRPFMLLSDGQRSARFNVGVFALTTPERQVGELPETFAVQGFDRLYLLNRPIGDTYTVAAGMEYLTAIRQVITDAGLSGVLLDGSAQGVTLPQPMVWPLVSQPSGEDDDTGPATWLRVVNDLLAAVNYRALWADENGTFRGTPYRPPAERAVEFTFDADSGTTLLGEQRTAVEDVWAIPNQWVFIRTNMPGDPPAEPVDGDGIYRVTNTSDGPTSVDARGLVWPRLYEYRAASQAALVGLGDRRVALDRAVTTRFEVSVGPFPPFGHADIYRYRDAAAGVDRKVQAVRVSLDLTGADGRMSWEAV